MRGMRTQEHEGLLALACLEARLREEHESLQGLDRGLVNVKLQARAPRIVLANSHGIVVSTEMGCISWTFSLIGAARVAQRSDVPGTDCVYSVG